ncbi:DUF7674 family protein [Chitinophagaceae bacterium MMS25-I14]
MINQHEVPMYLQETLPEISIEKMKEPQHVYSSVHALLDYTFQQVKEHNFPMVKKCFSIAEKLYEKGNSVVKNAIENVFVFSFSHLPCCNKEEKEMIMGIIPGTLYSVYMKQLLQTGI